MTALGNPLDYIAEDHLRQRAICAAIDRVIAEIQPVAEDLEAIRAYLHEELPEHLADDMDSLFPLMRERCQPEDEIVGTLDRLSEDFQAAARTMPCARAAIDRVIAAPGPFTEEERGCLAAFTKHERRHLIVENAIVMPLARARLTKADLDLLRCQMLERRGLDRVMETDDAE